MKNLLVALLLLCVSASCLADNGLSVAAQNEITRRGPAVERVGRGYEASADDKSRLWEAMKPPATNNDKWFITVVTSNNCPPCAKLKRDFATAPPLMAWANPDPTKHEDSHTNFHEYKVGDLSQNWRYGKLTGTLTPSVVIQPPLNGRYGDPANCLLIEGYDGNPQHMADDIRQVIGEYIERLDERPQSPAKRTPNRDLPFPIPVQDQQPIVKTTDNSLFFSKVLTAMFTMGTAAVVGIFALLCIREFRKETGKKLLVSDETVATVEKATKIDNATIVSIVSAVTQAMNQGKPTTPPASS